MPATFEIHGVEELRDDISALLRQYPTETEKELEKISNDFKNDVNKKFPHKGKSGGKSSVAKNWEKTSLKDAGSNMTTGVELTNTAPHFHLVEHGHRQVINPERYAALNSGSSRVFAGQKNKSKKRRYAKTEGMIDVGFVQGKHYCEKTRNEWNNGEFASRVEKHVDKLLRKYDL